VAANAKAALVAIEGAGETKSRKKSAAAASAAEAKTARTQKDSRALREVTNQHMAPGGQQQPRRHEITTSHILGGSMVQICLSNRHLKKREKARKSKKDR